MPRRSRVETVGKGDKVMELALTRGMSVAEVQATIMEEDGIFLSVDQIRNFMASAPSRAVSEAKALGQEKRLEPIFQYADKVRSLYDEVDQLKTRLVTTFDAEVDADQQKELVAFISKKHAIDYETAKKVVLEVKRSVVADKAMRLFLSAVQELRRTVELAAKLDNRGERSPSGGITVKNAVITGQDLQGLFDEAKRRQVVDVAATEKP